MMRVRAFKSGQFINDSKGHVEFLYQIRSLKGAISLLPLAGTSEPLRFLAGREMKEFFLLTPGEYEIRGEFWLERHPDELVSINFGKHAFLANVQYSILLDRTFEQAVLYEIELQIQEKERSQETSRGRSTQ